MKRPLIFALIIIASVFKTNAQANFLWAKQMGGVSGDAGTCIATDVAGNIYTTGHFNDTVDFDPGPGIYNLISAGSDDIFISKLDASGAFVWAKQIGGTGGDDGHSLDLDVVGNIYTTGHFFSDTVDFDPGVGVYNLSTADGSLFVCKLDASGNFIWAKNSGGVSNCIKVNSTGSIYIIGRFYNSADFDPGVGAYNLTSTGNADIFISKLNSFGSFSWAKKIGSIDDDEGKSIALDNAGNVYVTGYFNDTADFDPGAGVYNLIPTGYVDAFISRLDSSGAFAWAKNLGGAWEVVRGFSIAIDHIGNVYTTGTFDGTADFDPGIGIYNLTTAGSIPIYISKLDASGAFIWAKQFSGITAGSVNSSYSIAVDAVNNLYTTGLFSRTTDFDPDTNVYNLTSYGAGSSDVFVTVLDASGKFICAKQMGGTGDDRGTSIAVDASGNVCVTGYFNGIADFDPGAGIYDFTSAGNNNYSDAFIVKFDNTVGINEIFGANINNYDMTVFPNPTCNEVNLRPDFTGNYLVKIFDVSGREVFSSKENNPQKINVREFENGIYFVRVDAGGKMLTKKIVVQH